LPGQARIELRKGDTTQGIDSVSRLEIRRVGPSEIAPSRKRERLGKFKPKSGPMRKPSRPNGRFRRMIRKHQRRGGRHSGEHPTPANPIRYDDLRFTPLP